MGLGFSRERKQSDDYGSLGLGFSKERKEPEHDGKIHPFKHWNEDEDVE